MAAVDYAKYGLKPEVDYSAYGLTPEQVAPAPQPQQDLSYFGKWAQDAKREGANVLRLGGDILAGAAEGGQGLHNAPYNIANLIAGPGAASHMPTPTHINFSDMFGVSDPGLQDKLIQGGVQYAPYAAGESALIAGKALGFGGKLLANSLTGGVFGATQSNDPLSGSLLGAATNAGTGLAGRAISSIMPSNLIKNMVGVSPETLKKNVDIAGNTNTGLGDIVGSPFLKRTYENLLSKNPFSGADSKMAATASAITDKSNDIVNGYLGNTAPHEVEDKIGEALTQAAKDQDATKRALYKKAEDLADGIYSDLSKDEEMVRAYHGTTPEALNGILKTGSINGPAFFSPSKSTALDYAYNNSKNPVLIETDIPKRMLKVDHTASAGGEDIGSATSIYSDSPVSIKSAKIKKINDNGDFEDVYNPHQHTSNQPLKLELPTFAQKAAQHSAVINDQHFLKFDSDAKQLLGKLANYKNPVITSYSGNLGPDALLYANVKNPTLKESNILAGRLNSLSNQYRASPSAEDRNMASVFGSLGGALKSDIKEAINASGNQELKDAFESAEKNYKQNFSPFLDKDIYKFTYGDKKAEDILSTFIKTGSSTDKGAQISKLMDKLNPQAQNLVKYSYLSRAMRGAEDERSIDPRALKNLWSDNKLGQKQKAALFPSLEERQALDNHSKLIGMNSEALSRMYNPLTGQRGLDRGTFRSLPGALPTRYLTNKLTSPDYRRQLLQKMQEGAPSDWSRQIQALLTPAMVNNLGGGQ